MQKARGSDVTIENGMKILLSVLNAQRNQTKLEEGLLSAACVPESTGRMAKWANVNGLYERGQMTPGITQDICVACPITSGEHGDEEVAGNRGGYSFFLLEKGCRSAELVQQEYILRQIRRFDDINGGRYCRSRLGLVAVGWN